MEEPEWFKAVCAENGVRLTESQIGKLEQFAKLLLEWNRKINLISKKDEQRLWSRHILHSISILFKLRLPPHASMIDIGTGGGLPGIPLKILLPNVPLTLLDSTQKKINVVHDILQRLSLPTACAIWARAEDLGKQPDHRAQYDVVVARAVAPLKNLIRWSKPLLRRVEDQVGELGGQAQEPIPVTAPALIALKGGNIEPEVRSARRIPGVQSVKTIDLTFAGSDRLEAAEKKIVYVTYDRTVVDAQRS